MSLHNIDAELTFLVYACIIILIIVACALDSDAAHTHKIKRLAHPIA